MISKLKTANLRLYISRSTDPNEKASNTVRVRKYYLKHTEYSDIFKF